MKPFATISVCLNLATILIYGTMVRAQFDGLEENATISLKSVQKAECEEDDCNLAVHSTGSGSDLNDGCTKTGNICTGTCARCQDSRPAQVTGYCKKLKDTTKTCYVEEALSDTTQGKFSCGKSHKYQCAKNNDGPSTCCSKDQDGSQPIEGPQCDDVYACNPGQQPLPTGSGDGGENGGTGDTGTGDTGTGDTGTGETGTGETGAGDEGAGDTDPQMPTEP